jgi:redox-sensing transcriptional repressor
MKSEKISELTTSRLSVYLRCLNALHAPESRPSRRRQWLSSSILIQLRSGKISVTSVSLACAVLATTSTICANTITKILGLDTPHRVGIVGAGRLGTALANYNGFGRSNFTVAAHI